MVKTGLESTVWNRTLICYLFVTLAVVRTMVDLEERQLSSVLGHLDQTHGGADGGVASMYKHHHLKQTDSTAALG